MFLVSVQYLFQHFLYYLYSFSFAGLLPLSEIPTRALGSLLVRCFVFRTQIHSQISGVPLVPEAVADTIGARVAVVVSFTSFQHPLDFSGVEHEFSFLDHFSFVLYFWIICCTIQARDSLCIYFRLVLLLFRLVQF